jgi:hypothetical protein
MKKILLLTLAALFALTVSAFASPGGHSNDSNDNFDVDPNTFDTVEEQTVNVSIPVVFYLDWETAGDGTPGAVTFTIDETMLNAGNSATYDADAGDDLHFMANYNNLNLTVERSSWTAPGTLDDPTPDGEFTLQIWNYLAGTPGYVTIPDSGTEGMLSPQSLKTWPNGVEHTDFDVDYRLTNVSVEDNPGAYSSVVSFVFSYALPNS